MVKNTAREPRSYIVELDGKEYRRNRRHLLAVPQRNPIKEEPDELAPFEGYDDPVSAESTGTSTSRIYNENNVILNNTGSVGRVLTANHSQVSNGENEQQSSGLRLQPIVTRSGRISKPNSKYQDYVA